MSAVKILVFSGSLRTGSLNTKLAGAAAREMALLNAEVSFISLDDFPLPIYDSDLEAKSGIPQNAINLKRMIGMHDGIFIACPEYNHNPPPLVSNVIDWVSRIPNEAGAQGLPPMPVIALGSASSGPYGGARTLIPLRIMLCHGWGALVLPRMISVTSAAQAFDDTGHLKIEAVQQNLRNVVVQLIDVAGRMRK